MINISSLIKLDEYTNIIPLPRLQLMTRSFEIIGNISHYSDWRVSIRGNELDEISFTVTKYVNGVLNPIWDDIVDLKIVSLERGGKFEIQVTYTDESKTTKSVSGVSLETELGQVALYEFHVNDDDYDAMEMEKHGEIVPTVLYDPTRPDYSLIHRVLKDKTPHWTINDAKMPEYILVVEDREPEAVNAFQRQFTVDGTSIYDFLTGDVAKEANIVFRFDTDQRKLWFEPLLDYYDEHDQHIVDAIGEDTTILVSKRKLGNEITINSNKDSVKNCFRVEGGDDLINSQIAVLNMTGDNYIYHFADFQLADMPEDLREAVIHYSSWLDTYRDEYYGTVEEQGADGLYTQFTKANAQLYYLEHEMAPAVSPEPEVATPQAMWEKIKAIMDISQGHQIVGVADLNYITSSAFAGATNNVETMAQIDASDSRYKVEVVKDTTSYTDATHTWSGVIRVTRVSDTTQFYPPIVDNPSLYDQYKFNIEVREDTDTDLWYTRQKVDIALHKGEMSRVDAEFNDQTTPEEMERYFRQWNLTKLKSFSDGYDSCISTIMSGKSYQEREIAKDLYDVYKTRLDVLKGKLIDGVVVGGVLNERQAQVDEQQAIVDRLAGYTDDNGEYQKGELQKFQESKSFVYYLTNDTPDHERGIPVYTQAEADKMFKIYRSYIREDQYQNSNFVSDTYETDQNELIKVAKELLADAEKEIKKSCVLQRTMTVNVNNLLALPEFKPLYDKFDLFNYIRVRTDDEILKLRLIGIDYSGDSMQSVEVTFSDQIETVDGNVSDLQSVLDQAKSIATSYNAVTLQANKGAEAQGYVTNIVQNGLDAANTMLKNSNDNEVTISRAGIIAKRMDNEGEYGQKQLRIIGNGMYMTEDAWDSVAMAVGEITVPSLNNGNPMYGVIADAIVGRFIAGNSLYIGNEEGSVAIDGDGITITNGTITWDPTHEDGVNPPEIEDIPDLADTLEDLEHQVDGKIDTYYQALEPHFEHEGVEDNEEYNKDVGDLWYDTTNDKSFMYVKETVVPATTPTTYNYIWKESDGVPDEVYDKIDGKNTIYSTYPTDPQTGDLLIPASDITVGQTTYKAKKVYKYTGSSFVEIDYTDDSYVLNWIGTTYTTDKNNLQSQIDGKVDTYYQSTKPHQEYTGIEDNTEYDKWIGDLWYDTTNNKSFMYRKEEVTPSTTPATYNYKWEEADGVPQSVYNKINGKSTIYIDYPSDPQAGDLLIPATDVTHSSDTYYAGKIYRYNGSAFEEVNYTNDDALEDFIEGDYATFTTNIQSQVDSKAETWYQANDPATTESWSADEKPKHIGDLWYETGSQKTYVYEQGGTYQASGGYGWTFMNVPNEVFDEIDGKAAIYIAKPTGGYNAKDLWILDKDNADPSDPAYDSTYPPYKRNSILISSNTRTSGNYTVGDWTERVRYTDDSTVTTFITTTYANDKVRWDGKADTWYCTQTEIEDITDDWTTTALKQSHEGDIWYCTGIDSGSALYIVGHSYMYGSSSGTYAWREVDGVPKSVFDTIDGKRTIYTSKPETPQDDGYYYRQGDMWIINPTPPDTTITVNNVAYEANTILYASQDRSDRFHDEDWSPTTTKSAEDALDQISALDTDYSAFKTQVNGALSVTEIGQDYIISPKIGGGYLYLVAKSGNTITGSVEINPSGNTIKNAAGDTTSGYIIKATGTITENGVSSLATLFSINTSGSAYFRGQISASSGNIGEWKIRPQNIYNEYSYIYDNITYQIYSVLDPYGSISFISQTLGYETSLQYDNIYFSHRNMNYDPEDPDSTYRLSVCRLSYSSSDGMIDDTDDGLGEGLRVRLTDVSGSSNPFFCIMDGSTYYEPDIYFKVTNSATQINGNLSVSGSITAEGGVAYVSTLVPASKSVLNSCLLSDSAFRPVYPTTQYTQARLSLGESSYKWSSVYAENGTIQTSDRNVKSSITTINNSYEDLFYRLQPVSYKFNSGKRTHIGFISQDVEEAMNESNLTDMDFAGFCRDYKYDITVDEKTGDTESTQVFDEDGNPEYSYSLRYDEFVALNTHMIQKLYKRVEELEAEVASLKSK